MITNELEELLEATAESPSLEFKGPMVWNAAALAKDILAMTNTDEGGRIVIGIEDKTLRRVGVTPDQRNSFVFDTMRDQVAAFGEPHVTFEVECVRDAKGIEFVVITIEPFPELPVICTKTDPRAGTNEGVLYTRTRRRRPESAPVTRVDDLQRIIDRAAPIRLRRAQKFVDSASEAERGRRARLDEELEGL